MSATTMKPSDIDFACSSPRTQTKAVAALLFAIAFEILAAGFMKRSNGFNNTLHTIAAFVFANIGIMCTIIMLSKVELGIGWAVCTALELTGTILVGFFFFKEPISMAKLLGIIMAVLGIIVLTISEAEAWHPWPETWNEPLWVVVDGQEKSRTHVSVQDVADLDILNGPNVIMKNE